MNINLGSTRVAFFLIAILLLMIVLSAIIPQEDLSQEQAVNWKETLGENYVIIEKLGLDRIFITPTFFVLLGLLAINLLFGNIKRFKIVYRTERTLLRARHLGSILFHLSLLVIIAGVILNYMYKYTGVLAITEGQQVVDSRSAYFREFRGPFYDDAYDRFALTLDQVDTAYAVDDATAKAALISFYPAPGSAPVEKAILTNKPLVFNNLEIHFGIMTGYSPEVLLLDSTGNKLFKAFVRLATQKGHGGNKVFSDHVMIPAEQLKIQVTVDPKSPNWPNGNYDILVEKNEKKLYEGTLNNTDTVTVANMSLTVPRMRQWCYINVVKSPFLNVVFFGFWSALIGMTIGFIPRLLKEKKQE